MTSRKGSQLDQATSLAATDGIYIIKSGTQERATRDLLLGSVAYVDHYGAVGDGTADDREAIQDAITAAGTDGAVFFSPGKTYLIQGPINLVAGQTVDLRGATIKRMDEVTGTTTSNPNGQTSVTLTASHSFAVGMYVGLFEASTTKADYVAKKITGISGNTLTVESAFTPTDSTGTAADMTSGAVTVATLWHVMQTNTTKSSSAGKDGISIINGTIDGNRDNNTTTTRWELSANLLIAGDNFLCRDLSLINAVADGLLLTGQDALIEHCRFVDGGGDGVHLSDTILNDAYRGCFRPRITGCYFEDLNLENTAHDDGAIGFSNHIMDALIDHNFMRRCQSSLGGIESEHNSRWEFSNNTVVDMFAGNGNAASAMDIEGPGSYGYIFDCRILNNKFYLNPELLVDGNAFEGKGPWRLVFQDNLFVHTPVAVQKSSHVVFDGNTCLGGTTAKVAFRVKQCHKIKVDGNYCEGGGGGVQIEGTTDEVTEISVRNNYITQTANYGIRDQNDAAIEGAHYTNNTIYDPNEGREFVYNGNLHGDIGWRVTGDVTFSVDDAFGASESAGRAVFGSSGAKTLTQKRIVKNAVSYTLAFEIENYAGSGNITVTLGGAAVGTYSSNQSVSDTVSGTGDLSDLVINVPDGCSCQIRSISLSVATAAAWKSSSGRGIYVGYNAFVTNNTVIFPHTQWDDGIVVQGDNNVVLNNKVVVDATKNTINITGDSNHVSYNYLSAALADTGVGNTKTANVTGIS